MNTKLLRKKTLIGAVAVLIASMMLFSSSSVLSKTSTLENILLEEGFEEGTMPPTGWFKSDVNNAIWEITSHPDYVHSGDYAAKILGATGQPDSWLVSPAIDLTSYEEWVDISLNVWIYSRSDGMQGSFGQIWVHEYDDEPGSGFNKLEWRAFADRIWSIKDEDVVWPGYAQREVTVDISSYSGKFIKIAFAYAGNAGAGTGGSIFAIDDIKVFTGSLIPPTTIGIGAISSDLGTISVEIKNTGNTSTAKDVEWSISIKGGILDRIDILADGEIDKIKIGEKETISASGIFGLGRIDIEITAETESALPKKVTRETSAFVLFRQIYFMEFED